MVIARVTVETEPSLAVLTTFEVVVTGTADVDVVDADETEEASSVEEDESAAGLEDGEDSDIGISEQSSSGDLFRRT